LIIISALNTKVNDKYWLLRWLLVKIAS